MKQIRKLRIIVPVVVVVAAVLYALATRGSHYGSVREIAGELQDNNFGVTIERIDTTPMLGKTVVQSGTLWIDDFEFVVYVFNEHHEPDRAFSQFSGQQARTSAFGANWSVLANGGYLDAQSDDVASLAIEISEVLGGQVAAED